MDFKTEQNRIYYEEDGKLLAEILFPEKDGTATITHTFVDSSLGGRGIAAQLVAAAVERIKASGWSVNATCSYAKKWLENDPQQ